MWHVVSSQKPGDLATKGLGVLIIITMGLVIVRSTLVRADSLAADSRAVFAAETRLHPYSSDSFQNAVDASYDRWAARNSGVHEYVIARHNLFGSTRRQEVDAGNLRRGRRFGRFDRTSNHTAAQFMISIRGYSLFESDENTTRLWSLNRSSYRPSGKPILFIGIQKRFH